VELWKLSLEGIVAYGGTGSAGGFVGSFSRDWMVWSFRIGYVAGFGWLCVGGDVCHDRERALYWYEARFGGDGSSRFPSAYGNYLLHRSSGISGRGGIAAA
jgi:hypothetical protein